MRFIHEILGKWWVWNIKYLLYFLVKDWNTNQDNILQDFMYHSEYRYTSLPEVINSIHDFVIIRSSYNFLKALKNQKQYYQRHINVHKYTR